ncbi:hypothetical protein Xehl_00302 [Xenorhabdus ehlersii]|uniref:Transposase n=1 Tax=Xenorhabdus ehlersii TaxID=290111 RepID=A0A2D0IXG1_9GAMM|nr:hypothetical protein Xehl_00302 [Xenorhabdus ehlersii]
MGLHPCYHFMLLKFKGTDPFKYQEYPASRWRLCQLVFHIRKEWRLLAQSVKDLMLQRRIHRREKRGGQRI